MKTKMKKSERDAEITLAGEAAYLDAKRRGESEDKALDELIDAEKAAAAENVERKGGTHNEASKNMV